MTTPNKIAANRRNAQLSTGPRTPAGKLVVAQNAVRHGVFAHLPVVPGECETDWHAHRRGILDSLAPVGLLEVTLAERAALLLWRLARLSRYEADNTANAIEDAGLLPPEADPIAHTAGRYLHHENQLTMAEQELRRQRENLAVVTDEANMTCLALASEGDSLLPASSVKAVLGEAHTLVSEYYPRQYEPEWHTDRAFLDRLGFNPTRPKAEPWPREQFSAAVGYYADATGHPDDFRVELRRVLEARVARFARMVARQEAEVAALSRRLGVERQRRESAVLLPPAETAERIMKYEKHLHGQLTSTLHELERLQARRGGVLVPPPAVADLFISVNQG